VALAWLALGGSGQVLARPAAKPKAKTDTGYNVVIITADTLRADMLGCLGNSEVQTPNLDALATEGINFIRAYTNITTTTPSHATLFSSLYPRDHKVYSNRGRVPDEVVTLDEVLHRNGWTTAAIINMRWLNPDKGKVLQRLDQVADCREPRWAHRTTGWALDYLDRQKKERKPFFLWVHYIDNHTPYHAPGRFERMYYPAGRDPMAGTSGSLQKVWSEFPTHHQDEPSFQRWLEGVTDVDYVIGLNKGSVSYVDLQVGKLIERLKHNGQWKRTLFVFTSDHGESLGEHHIWFAHSGLYEPTARVPLLMRVPDGPSNRFVRTLVSLADVMPTLLARLGLEAPANARGRDVWPALHNDDPTGSAVFLEHAGGQLTGLVTPRYKYIRHLRDKSYNPLYPLTRGREELYDLDADPAETRDIAAEQPDLLARLRTLWEQLRDRRGSDHRATRAPVDAQTEEMLRSLGYTQ
jgi:arylsulfatase A-like enzyme